MAGTGLLDRLDQRVPEPGAGEQHRAHEDGGDQRIVRPMVAPASSSRARSSRHAAAVPGPIPAPIPVPPVCAQSFQGSVVRPGLLEVLESCRDLGLSGLLRVSSGAAKAEVHIDQGRLRAAVMGEFTGTTALTRAILLEQADFALAPAEQRPPRNIHQDTAFVLQSIAKVLVNAGIKVPPRPTRSGDASGARPAQPGVGATLGHCRLVTEFARGANSLIFLAWHQTLKIDVVVKVLLPCADGAPHALLLTANEAHILARLGHPAIMRIYDFDDQGSYPYLVMEYIDGQSLTRLISDRRRLDAATCLPIFLQVAEGLAYATAASGMIHCDIKPDNLLLDRSGRVRIADFGLAGVPGRGETSLHAQLAARGTVIGTPTYIAPELVEGGIAKADQRSDIYSLGATLYHALTGQPPFTDPDPIQLMVKRLREMPADPLSLHAEADKDLAELAMRMLATDPSARPQSHREVLEHLADLDDARSKVIRRRTSFWQYFSAENTAQGG